MPANTTPVDRYADALGTNGLVLDVREPDEVAEGTIPGALHIPLGELHDRVGELDPGTPVAVLCRSGGRSAMAAEFLDAAGFGQVTNLEGGILAYSGTLGAPASPRAEGD
ncbi:MAG: rhodanese-like domain-containing protein [Actinomycetota bacterium]